MATKLI